MRKLAAFALSVISLISLAHDNEPIMQKNDFHIVKCATHPNTYERILMTQLRDKNSTQEQFRNAANKLIELLVPKVVECLATQEISIETPVAPCKGEVLNGSIQ